MIDWFLPLAKQAKMAWSISGYCVVQLLRPFQIKLIYHYVIPVSMSYSSKGPTVLDKLHIE